MWRESNCLCMCMYKHAFTFFAVGGFSSHICLSGGLLLFCTIWGYLVLQDQVFSHSRFLFCFILIFFSFFLGFFPGGQGVVGVIGLVVAFKFKQVNKNKSLETHHFINLNSAITVMVLFQVLKLFLNLVFHRISRLDVLYMCTCAFP